MAGVREARERSTPALVAGLSSREYSDPQLRGDGAWPQQVWGAFRDWGSLGLTAGGGDDRQLWGTRRVRSWHAPGTPSWGREEGWSVRTLP